MKIFKRLILGLTILAVLLIGGVFLAINLIDPNDYKVKIQALALEKTGRTLNIDGDIALSYFPWIGFSLGSISMANPEGFGDSPFVAIDSAQVKVKLVPLLKKSITVNSIELAGLNLDLQRAADGSTNWEDLSAEQQSSDGTENSDTSGTDNSPADNATDDAPAIEDLSIGAIVITDANVNWRDDQNSTDARLSSFDLSTNTIELGKPFSLTTNFNADSTSAGVKADVEGSGDISLDLDNQQYLISNLTTNFNVDSTSAGVTAQVEGSGDISLDLDNQQYKVSNLKLATDASGEAIPVNDFTLNLTGDLAADLTAQTASLNSLTIDSAGVKLSGDMQITDLSGNPAIDSTLTSNEFSPRELAEKLDIELPVTADAQAVSYTHLTLPTIYSV